MATLAALKDGLKDARTGRSPYFWTVLTQSGERRARLHEGLKATTRIIVLGLVMDGAYQFVVLRTFYPGEALIMAVLLAFVPYLLLRGPVARIAAWWSPRAPSGAARRGRPTPPGCCASRGRPGQAGGVALPAGSKGATVKS